MSYISKPERTPLVSWWLIKFQLEEMNKYGREKMSISGVNCVISKKGLMMNFGSGSPARGVLSTGF